MTSEVYLNYKVVCVWGDEMNKHVSVLCNWKDKDRSPGEGSCIHSFSVSLRVY